jgi:hypothetical protein
LFLGALYGEHSETAPGFFRGMAEAMRDLSGEHPFLASLSYWEKAKLLAYATFPVYTLQGIVFVLVSLINLVSRIVPWSLPRSILQGGAILLAALPFLLISLWCLAFFVLAYVQAWAAGLLTFVVVVVIWPAVAIKVVSAWVGVFLLARGFVPAGLAFAGRKGPASHFVGAFLTFD